MQSVLRRHLLKKTVSKIRYTALPNQIAWREVVPEVRVEHDPAEITRVAADLLADEQRRLEIGNELRALMGNGGASDKVAEIILSAVDGSSRQSFAVVGGQAS